ncbi:MAG: hypothetical protein AB7O52_19375 [Planctomycetota bacterium]
MRVDRGPTYPATSYVTLDLPSEADEFRRYLSRPELLRGEFEAPGLEPGLA